MTENKANIYLKNNYKKYFYSYNKDVNYMAVVKKSNDFSIDNDYMIEIGYNKFNDTDRFFIDEKNRDKEDIKKVDFINLIDKYKGFRFKEDKERLIYNKLLNSNKKHKNEKKTISPITSSTVFFQSFYKATERFKNLKGGISISQDNNDGFSGTAGAFFKLKNSDETYLITNKHVVDFGNNTDITHPSMADVSINNISPIRQIIGNTIWKDHNKNNDFFTMDAAIIKIDSKFANKINTSRCSGIEYKNVDIPKIGDLVRKCGRSSGLTCGYIRSVNCIVRIKKSLKLFSHQILTTPMSLKGDSGSVLVNQNNNVVGLLFAGSIGETYATDINKVIKKAFNNNSIEKFI